MGGKWKRGGREGEGKGRGEGGKREGKGEGRRSVPANKNLRLHPCQPLYDSKSHHYTASLGCRCVGKQTHHQTVNILPGSNTCMSPATFAFSTLTLLVQHWEDHLAYKNIAPATYKIFLYSSLGDHWLNL